MLKGKISNINSTIYTVDVNNQEYFCSLKGRFRYAKITPLVGDYVDINEQEKQIINIYPRINSLTRPNIANVDIALIITSTKNPNLDLVLLDKLLVHIINNKIKPIICFTKIDLLNKEELNTFKKIKKYYEDIGIKTINNTEISLFNKLVKNKVVVTCGQTGSGKSSFINKLDSHLNLQTNAISLSLNRGIHTTRYVSLYKIKDYYIADTPGFSALDLKNFTKEQIKDAFLEFNNYSCKYKDCFHINTDGCKILNNQNILLSRYENYCKFIKEVQ